MKATAKVVLVAVLAVVSAACSTVVQAKPDPVEVTFWDCNRAANTGFMGSMDAAGCSANFEQFKRERFGGDFNKLMVYFNANKHKYQ